MSDTSTGTEAATTAPAEGAESGTETPPEGTSTPDNKTTFDADYVKALRSESAGHRTKLRAVEAERDSLAEKVSGLETSAPALEQRATTAEALATRYEVALEKGLSLALAKRLVGATREELVADADELKGQVGTTAPPADLGQGAREPVAQKADVNAALRKLARG